MLGGYHVQGYAYNGAVPGPLLRLHAGDRVRLTFTNQLDAPTNLHTHGLPVSPDVDDPFTLLEPGESRLHEFTLPADAAGTHWYHPHPHGDVARQQFAGLIGPIVVDSPLDAMPELQAAQEEVIVLHDTRIGFGAVRREHSFLDNLGKLGNLVLVNGAHQPVLQASKALLRLRFINASNARPHLLACTDRPLYLIATDGGFIERPQALDQLLLVPGERAEVLIQCDQAGHFAVQRLPYDDGNFVPGRTLTEPETLFTVEVPQALQKISLPDYFAPVEVIDPVQAVRTRSFDFSGPIPFSYTINGQTFDHHRVDVKTELGSSEIWELSNGNDLIHPFHLHSYPFQILAHQPHGSDSWQAEPLRAWRDTINLPGKAKVRIIVPFRTFTGRTVFHCHISEHEDRGMMGVIEVGATGAQGPFFCSW
jgi:FtsP/CotA-like multicopper oxidase with cupredoxin domain